MKTDLTNTPAADAILKAYTDHWDDVLRRWAEDGDVPAPERCWFEGAGSTLIPCLMPEPYWGDPAACSAVLLNYNPGDKHRKEADFRDEPTSFCRITGQGGKALAEALRQGYSAEAKTFPWLDAEQARRAAIPLPERACRWLRRRAGWTGRLAGDEGGARRPFFMELCAWHSHRWTISRFSDAQKAYITQLVLPTLRAAVRCSTLGVGLAVGKRIGGFLQQECGFRNITGELRLADAGGRLDCDREDGGLCWQPIPTTKRWYRVYRCDGDGTVVVVTWSPGSNNQPSRAFAPQERELLARIGAYRAAACTDEELKQ